MMTFSKKDFPVLLVDDELQSQTAEGTVLRAIVKDLELVNCSVVDALTCQDGLEVFTSHAEIGCIVLEWEIGLEKKKNQLKPSEFIAQIRQRNPEIPVFIITEKLSIKDIPLEILDMINGYIWKTEDTPSFIAGRIETALTQYVNGIMPDFFRELVKYAEEYKYAWHTPGHMGGVAFLKTPAGRACHKFFGENVFRADLSISVPELGSLLDHDGVVGKAEKEAAKVFNSNLTYFVLNGTSTANQIVWHARVTKGDIALVDRNCHKSLNYAMIVTGATPVYFVPTRNAYGTIGPIHLSEFDKETIRKKIEACRLIKVKDKKKRPKMAVVTNSTYDGLCYNVLGIKDRLSNVVDNLHFDEAWYAYARFHPIYEHHYGMTSKGEKPDHPPVFTTHSTHKLLAAWSQGSMIHVKNGGNEKISHDLFNEAYMMHGSTSPQYGIIATLDVAARMMKGQGGRQLMNETLEEPIIFRKKMVQIGKEIRKKEKNDSNTWWFTSWQPETVRVREKGKTRKIGFDKADTRVSA